MISSLHGVVPRSTPPHADEKERLPGKLAVLTSYFNPCGYQLRRAHYDRFAEAIAAQGVDLFTAELALNDHPFTLGASERVRRYRSRHVLWHKERLLNVLLKTIPDDYDKLVWVDADVLFECEAWPLRLAELLEKYPVVQLFDEVVYLDREGRPMQSRPSVAWAVANGVERAWNLGRFHPGFGWAARRDLLERHGLLDNHILGGADSIMVCSMFGWWKHPLVRCYHPVLREAMLRWGRDFHRDVRGRVSWLPNRLIHLWHGDRIRRQYVERIGWMTRAAFDPAAHLQVDGQGLWEWRDRNSWLSQRVQKYFEDRREDG